MSKEQKLPFEALGQRLKAVRQKLQESVPEVSGAVEIDTGALERIEQGSERPSEDILQLLISHFDVPDSEAVGLWQLAGYELPEDRLQDDEDMAQQAKGAIMVLALDPRIVYSDHVQVSANKSGVVFNFAQKSNMSQALVTARIGMSREQAKEVARTITEALQRSEPNRLQNPDNKNNKKPPKHSQ